jgi:YD repeat-containing protein
MYKGIDMIQNLYIWNTNLIRKMKAPLLIAISVAAVLVSCTKSPADNNTGNGADNIPKIRTRATSAETTTFTYDGNGKVLTEISTNGRKAEYTYTPGQIKKTYTYNGGINENYIYTLNASGFVTRIASPDAGNNSSIEYGYNSDNFLSYEIDIFQPPATSSQRADYFFTNDNADSLRFTDLSGNWRGTLILSYYLDKPRIFGFENQGIYFYGKGNAKMMKSQQWRYPVLPADRTDFQYEYDINNRVIKITRTNLNGSVFTESYTYY